MTALDDLLGVVGDGTGDHPAILSIRVAYQGAEITLVLAGELDLSVVRTVHDATLPLLAENPARLSIDLSELDFCDCGGLRFLHWAAHRAAERGIAFRLVEPSAQIRRVFALTRADDLLSACRTNSPTASSPPQGAAAAVRGS